MGGSPKPPPPPPDHSGNRANFASQQSAARRQQANEFNQGVTDFNNQLSGFSSQVGDLSGRIEGLGVQDYNDLDNYRDEVTGLTRQLRGLNFNEVRPNFESVTQSPWGAVSVDTPGLLRADTNQRDTALMELQDAQRQLSDIQKEYRGHERDLTGFKSDIFGQLTGLNSQVGNLGIGNENMINTQRGQLDALRGQLAAYDNPIADMSPQTDRWMNRLNPLFDQADAAFADLDQRRQAEQDRITGFANQIYGGLGELEDTLGGLSIADQDGMRAAERQLRNFQRQKAGFSSELDADFARERALADDLGLQLQDLMAQRQEEEARIEEARRNFRDQARFLGSQARMGDVYDGNQIQGLMDDIAMLRDERAGFSSVLDPQFAMSGQMLDSAEQRLSQLMNQRGEHIGRLQDQLGNLTSDFEGIDPNNEMALRQARTRAENLQNQLGRFSGQDIMGLNFEVQDQVAQIDNSLQELDMQRQQLQQQAQQMLQHVQESQYRDMDSITGVRDEARAMREQAQLMNAERALQEINRIMQHLEGEKGRLTADAQNVASAQQRAERDVMGAIGPNGVPQFPNTPMIEGMTPEQYLALLQRQRLQDDQSMGSGAVNTNTFSASLGI